MLGRQLPWLVALLMSLVADIPSISLTFLAHPSASQDLIGLLEKFSSEKHTKCHILSDKPIHFLLLPFFKVPQTCQWILDEVFSSTKILFSLASRPHSLDDMVQSVAEFLKVVFSAFKFKAASGVLGKDLIKQHLIKVDHDTLCKKLEKPWKQLEKCSAKSRALLREQGLLIDDSDEDNVEVITAAVNDADLSVTTSPSSCKPQQPDANVLSISKTPSNHSIKSNKAETEIEKPRKKNTHRHKKDNQAGSPVNNSAKYASSNVKSSTSDDAYKHKPWKAMTDIAKSFADSVNSFDKKGESEIEQLEPFLGNGPWERIYAQQMEALQQAQLRVPGPPPGLSATPQYDNGMADYFEQYQKNFQQQGSSDTFSYVNELSPSLSDQQPTYANIASLADQQPTYASDSSLVEQHQQPPTYVNIPAVAADQQLPTYASIAAQLSAAQSAEGFEGDCNKYNLLQQEGDTTYFPSAYMEQGELLGGLSGFLACKPNARGDTSTHTDSHPSGIRQTFEYDDYRTDEVMGRAGTGKPDQCNQASPGGNDSALNISRKEDFQTRGQAPTTPTSILQRASAADNSNSQQGNIHSGYVGEKAPAQLEMKHHDEEIAVHEDEFQWNWTPRSKRFRDQLMLLINSKPGEQKRIGNVYYISFDDESMVIGETHRSKVVLGIHSDGTEVALKRIPRGMLAESAPDPNIPFAKHPCILNYKDWDEDEEYVYVARELCEYSLEEYIQSLSEMAGGDGAAQSNGQGITRQLLDALSAFHAAGTAHTNLKPQNLLLTAAGTVALVDAGIWYKTQQSDEGNSWVAPEMLHPNDAHYYQVTDMFVAGLLCFYTLSGGHHPYGSSEEPTTQRANIAAGELKVFHGQLTDALALDLILTCLLMAAPDERSSVHQCLKHAYFWSDEKKFDFLSKVASQPEVKADLACPVTTPINSAQQWIGINNWYEELNKDLRKLADKLHYKGSTSITSLLRFLKDANNKQNNWSSSLRRRIPNPKKYFVRQYPRLLMPVFEICRDSAWAKRDSLKPFFQ